VYASEESAGPFVVSGCNGAVLLEFLEEILDQVPPFFIHLFIVFQLFGSIGLGRDASLNFSPFQQLETRINSWFWA
jgi:hypothetical protein